MASFMWINLLFIAVLGGLGVLGVYVIILFIKALKIYIKNNS